MTGWRKRQVLEMAEQAGMLQRHNTGYDVWIPEYLEEFVELVRADEREKFLAALRLLHDSYSLASDSNGLKERGQA